MRVSLIDVIKPFLIHLHTIMHFKILDTLDKYYLIFLIELHNSLRNY
jgi:hypothetical protein